MGMTIHPGDWSAQMLMQLKHSSLPEPTCSWGVGPFGGTAPKCHRTATLGSHGPGAREFRTLSRKLGFGAGLGKIWNWELEGWGAAQSSLAHMSPRGQFPSSNPAPLRKRRTGEGFQLSPHIKKEVSKFFYMSSGENLNKPSSFTCS